jgi:hypothetical protein
MIRRTEIAVTAIAVLSLTLASCMPVSGIFRLGMGSSPETRMAVRAEAPRSVPSGHFSSFSNARALDGDMLYFIADDYDSATSTMTFDLYSLSLAQGGVETLLNGTNTVDFQVLAYVPSSITGSAAEIHGISDGGRHDGSKSVTRFALDGSVLGTVQIPAVIGASIGQNFSVLAGNGGIYTLELYSSESSLLVKLDKDYQLVWSVDVFDSSKGYLAGAQCDQGMAFSPSGDLYLPFAAGYAPSGSSLADLRGGGVYAIDAATGSVKAFHAGGYAFSNPTALSFDASGTLFAFNSNRRAIQSYSADFLPDLSAAEPEWESLGGMGVLGIQADVSGFRILIVMDEGITVYRYARP